MRSKWHVLFSILAVTLIAVVVVGFYFIFSQKRVEKKPQTSTPPSTEERVPQKEEAIKHEREDRGNVAPLGKNRRFLR